MNIGDESAIFARFTFEESDSLFARGGNLGVKTSVGKGTFDQILNEEFFLDYEDLH